MEVWVREGCLGWERRSGSGKEICVQDGVLGPRVRSGSWDGCLCHSMEVWGPDIGLSPGGGSGSWDGGLGPGMDFCQLKRYMQSLFILKLELLRTFLAPPAACALCSGGRRQSSFLGLSTRAELF